MNAMMTVPDKYSLIIYVQPIIFRYLQIVTIYSKKLCYLSRERLHTLIVNFRVELGFPHIF